MKKGSKKGGSVGASQDEEFHLIVCQPQKWRDRAGNCVFSSEGHGKGQAGSRGINLGVTGVFFKAMPSDRQCK